MWPKGISWFAPSGTNSSGILKGGFGRKRNERYVREMGRGSGIPVPRCVKVKTVSEL
jgi:hypothetical protein